MQCANHFHQVAVALHNYHAAANTFPPGWQHAEFDCGLDFFFEGFGWSTFILPYTEREDVYSNLTLEGTFPARFKDTANGGLNACGALIEVFICPTDPQSEPRVEVTNLFDNGDPNADGKDDHGRTNMAGAADSIDWTCSTRTGQHSRFPDPQANGILRGWASSKIRDLTDGTSNTILVGEVIGAGPGTWRGFFWSSCNITQASGGINGPYHGRDSGFASYHPGGCHFALADGRIRFVAEEIDQIILERLVARNDGEMVPEF